jgi:hypothetical protein
VVMQEAIHNQPLLEEGKKMNRGQHVYCGGTFDCEVIILEINGSEARVQEKGTQRDEVVPTSWLR